MSYSYAYNPKVSNPNMRNNITQMASGGFQTPFFMGGSQVPVDLFLPKNMYNGAKGSGFHKGMPSKTVPTDLDFTTKKGNKVFHRKGHNIKIPFKLPFMK
jgi:hypothetical protein